MLQWKSSNLHRAIIVVGIAVVSIIVIILVRNSIEKKLLLSERDKISSYLSEKYRQEFEVGEVKRKDMLLFGGGGAFKAICKDENLLEFEITRYSYNDTYDDGYPESLLIARLNDEIIKSVKEINDESRIFISCSYDGDIENIINKEMKNEDVRISVHVDIPESVGFSKDKYNSKILENVNRLYDMKFDSFFLSIKFYDETFKNDVNKYFDLKKQGVADRRKEEILEDTYESAQLSVLEYKKRYKEKETIDNLSEEWKDIK